MISQKACCFSLVLTNKHKRWCLYTKYFVIIMSVIGVKQTAVTREVKVWIFNSCCGFVVKFIVMRLVKILTSDIFSSTDMVQHTDQLSSVWTAEATALDSPHPPKKKNNNNKKTIVWIVHCYFTFTRLFLNPGSYLYACALSNRGHNSSSSSVCGYLYTPTSVMFNLYMKDNIHFCVHTSLIMQF